MRLIPTSTHIIPVHPATDGWDVQKLAVEKHEFPSPATSHQKIAFLFSHSNGFHKEAYHPLIRRFKDQLRSLKEYDHTDIHIIAWDSRFHGDSARLNQGEFMPTYRWLDNALDAKQVIDKLELKQNYDQFIGVGHSFGATSMALLESFYPHTFDALCLLEPVLKNEFIPTKIRETSDVYASRTRRDEWPNREECQKFLLKRPFWRQFHPEALENYVNYGMYDTDQGTIKLKCPKEHEALIFSNANAEGFITYNTMKTLEIPTHCTFAFDSFMFDVNVTESLIQSNPKNITIECIKGGHMVPCENPDSIIPQIMKLIERLNRIKQTSKL